jgi:two-component system phosphate regulon sensor histidine kinase PhoR|tara:strand:- start:169 stop:1212 length:1044 start_codon:yes stop_codon:yes gene_type:complete
LKINSPKNIALLNALVITIISGVAFLIITVSINQINAISIVIFLAFIFVLSFVFINYSLNTFFSEKIKVIYKTIGRTGPNPDDMKKDKNKGDVLEIVNQVVLRWSEEKKKEIDELKEMAAYRREFLGNISHEIKTPIFNIQGYVHTLLEGGLKDDSINTKFLKKSVKSINRMIALVEDLEEISKLEVGDLKLKEENFNLHELIKEVVDFMEHKAAENKTTIKISTALPKSTKVRADKERIRQVLINLIDNAIKYGKLENGRIRISFYNFQDNYLVEVRDNGIGISEENIKRVFERFYRTEQSRARDKGGTGLGLAIVKHIIEAHRQTISVRSNLGRGTTFSFTLKTA